MARPVTLLAVIAVGFAAPATGAEASQIDSQTVDLTGAVTSHQNRLTRDGVASSCAGNVPPKVPTQITSAQMLGYRAFHFQSFAEQPVCVTADISTACTGTDEVMSATYSPFFQPADVRTNWIADLGNSPPAQTSYGFIVPAHGEFQTVLDEVSSSANCTSVTITWTSDRPWATGTPDAIGVPAVGGTLKAQGDAWKGSPAVARQWRRCDLTGANCADILGATASEYVVGNDDVGHTVRLRESATESNLTSTVQSDPTTEVFIPFETHDDRLASGDRSVLGSIGFTGVPSRCGTATAFPGLMDNEARLFDTYAFASRMNEPACVWVARQPGCLGMLTLYNPRLTPSDQAQNFVATDDGTAALSYTLEPGAAAEAMVVEQGALHLCGLYSLLLGSDGPFATGRPALAGPATEGAAETTTNGAWSGSPAFAQAWLRCGESGAGCAPIAGASGATYTPTRADVGHRLRSRVTATRVKSRSSDSDPSAVITRDRTAPRARLRIARTTLQKVVKRGFIPVVVTCNEACRIALRADVRRRLGERLGGRRIGRGKGNGRAGRSVRIRVRFTRRARKALRGNASLTFTVHATLTDAAGNRGKASRRARVRRRGA